MKVFVKDLYVQMEVKQKGMELEIRTPANEFLGDVVITKTGLTWCEGRTNRQNGKFIKWEDLITLINKKSNK